MESKPEMKPVPISVSSKAEGKETLEEKCSS
jgi:hypothetical protein